VIDFYPSLQKEPAKAMAVADKVEEPAVKEPNKVRLPDY
jgi:hypothetical protein